MSNPGAPSELAPAAPVDRPPAPRPSPVSRWTATHLRESLLVGAILAIAYVYLATPERFAVGAFKDDGVYVSLGKALASGAGYRSIYAVGQPLETNYPPGLPVIYAVLWWIGGSLPVVVRLITGLNLLACAVAGGTIWWLARARMGIAPVTALMLAGLPFLLDPAVQYFSLPIGEPLLVLGWAGILVLCRKLPDPRGGLRASWVALALGLALAATSLVRMQAVVLVPAVLLALAYRRAWRAGAVCAAAAILPILTWRWIQGHFAGGDFSASQPRPGTYESWIPLRDPVALASVAAHNADAYWNQFVGYLHAVPLVGSILLAGFIGLAVIGAVRSLRGHPAVVLTVVASLGLVLLWPFNQDRYVLSLLPVAGLLAAKAAHDLIVKTPVRARPWIYGLLAVCGASVLLHQRAIRHSALDALRGGTAPAILSPRYIVSANSLQIRRVSDWILANTAPDDRLMVESPPGIFLHTGRRGVFARPMRSNVTAAKIVPGRYLAGRIRADSVDVVVLESLESPLAFDIAALGRSCPGVLRFLGGYRPSGLPAFYRVHRDPCIERFLGRSRAGTMPPASAQFPAFPPGGDPLTSRHSTGRLRGTGPLPTTLSL